MPIEIFTFDISAIRHPNIYVAQVLPIGMRWGVSFCTTDMPAKYCDIAQDNLPVNEEGHYRANSKYAPKITVVGGDYDGLSDVLNIASARNLNKNTLFTGVPASLKCAWYEPDDPRKWQKSHLVLHEITVRLENIRDPRFV